jgi:hypothetical protein
MTNWKTTVAGLLSAFVGTIGPVTAYLATTNNPKATEVCGALTCAGAVARIWIGLIQNDAGTTLAVVPGSPSPQLVPSHETPDNPAATPVKEQ